LALLTLFIRHFVKHNHPVLKDLYWLMQQPLAAAVCMEGIAAGSHSLAAAAHFISYDGLRHLGKRIR